MPDGVPPAAEVWQRILNSLSQDPSRGFNTYQEACGRWAFLSGGFVNMFVPSGGGQWAVQGPIFIEAAQQLGTDPPRIVMGVAYGDQWTNMVQPFFTIPLLAIAGLHVRQIMGYTFVVLFVTFFILGGGILLAGSGA